LAASVLIPFSFVIYVEMLLYVRSVE